MVVLKSKSKQATPSKRRIESPRLFIIKLFRFSMIVALAVVSVWFWFKFKDPKSFPIQEVSVTGHYSHLVEQNLKNQIEPFVQSSFFTINIYALKEKLQENPWIEDADIRLVWPDKLLIHLTEQKPVAIWNSNSLLNAQGTIFSPPKQTFPHALPLFNAPEEHQQLVLDTYYNLSTRVSQLGLFIVELDLTPRLAWYVRLSNGLEIILGRDNIDDRMKNFIASYKSVIADKVQDIDYLDLRYSNGFALKWKVNQKIV